ncbi:DUF3575 domain-containing protein [Alistipes sp. cv1]|uniref:DUF3575 domain-containing protein n=1 Tax=Alistipes sp. cv1 TaxID=1622071 RepID=UPI000C78494C|nr:DUF3575 domain-containing protein [Alistipes sp. cv1]
MSVKKIFLSVICLSCFLSAHAGQGADSVRIYYRAGYRYVESDYRDNGMQLSRFTESVRRALRDGTIERIVVRSGASPDGANRANELLSERRADSLVSYIVRHTDVSASLIDRQAAGIAWDELRAQVAASGMLYRDEVLDVLDNTPVWIFDEKNQVVGGRKQRLMDLRGGEPYRYMLREFFPDLRSSVVVTLYFRSEETPESTQPPAVAPPPAPEPGLKPAENDEPQPATVPDTAAAPERTDEAGEAIPALIGKASPEAKGWTPRLVVKTNAVGWAMAISNVAVEIDLSQRLSLNIPVYYSAWNYFSGTTKFRILAAQPELRYWPTRDRRFFAGVHFGVASYNLALGGKWRIQDHDGTTPALGGGVSVGYRMPLGRNDRWNVEFSLGAGAYRLHYDKFHNEPGGAYSSTVRKTFFGVDNAAVSFSYTFDLKKKGGRR